MTMALVLTCRPCMAPRPPAEARVFPGAFQLENQKDLEPDLVKCVAWEAVTRSPLQIAMLASSPVDICESSK